MGGDNLVDLRCYEGFYTEVIFQDHQQLVYKGFVGIYIPRIRRVE